MVKSTDLTKIAWLDFELISSQLSKPELELLAGLGITQALIEASSIQEKIEVCEAIMNIVSNPEGIRLNRWFDTKSYLQDRPDVRNAKINPAYHYLIAGHKEANLACFGKPSTRLDTLRIRNDIGEDMFNPEKLVASWRAAKNSIRALSSIDIAALLDDKLESAKFIVFSISHDNPYINTGGIQRVIREETAHAIENSICYVHISPVSPLPFVADIVDTSQPAQVNISIDNVPAGVILETALLQLFTRFLERSFVVIHHVFGLHCTTLGLAIKLHATNNRAYFWVHDYSVCCTSYTLLKNKRLFCKSPPIKQDLGECSFCQYLPSREKALKAMKYLTQCKGLQFIYPSVSAQEVIADGISAIPTSSNHLVIEHIVIEDIVIERKIINFNRRKSRIAFVGMPVRHKGWDEFSILATDPYLSTSYEWIHIGKSKSQLAIKFYEANGIEGKTITDWLKELEIDLAFIWPLWPETFCLVAYESMLAGCHIITHPNSGNVATGLPSQIVSHFQSIDEVRSFLLESASQSMSLPIDICSNASLGPSNYTFSVIKSI